MTVTAMINPDTDLSLDSLREAGVWIPIASEAPGENFIPLDDYPALIGVKPDDADSIQRIRGWALRRLIVPVEWSGRLYVRRPTFRVPPPEYMSVQEFAAKREVSDSYIYALIQECRIRPVWSHTVAKYRHHFVASWAMIAEP